MISDSVVKRSYTNFPEMYEDVGIFINIWMHDLGRYSASSEELIRRVIKIAVQQFSLSNQYEEISSINNITNNNNNLSSVSNITNKKRLFFFPSEFFLPLRFTDVY